MTVKLQYIIIENFKFRLYTPELLTSDVTLDTSNRVSLLAIQLFKVCVFAKEEFNAFAISRLSLKKIL